MKLKKNLLIIGCGNKAIGNVNIDLHPYDLTQCMRKWNPHKIEYYITATAEELPFPNKSFNYIIATHVIEHIENPIKAMKEMSRVCTKKTILITPSQYGNYYCSTHLYSWNINTLKASMLKAFPKVKTGYTNKFHANYTTKDYIFNILYHIFRINTEIYGIGIQT